MAKACILCGRRPPAPFPLPWPCIHACITASPPPPRKILDPCSGIDCIALSLQVCSLLHDQSSRLEPFRSYCQCHLFTPCVHARQGLYVIFGKIVRGLQSLIFTSATHAAHTVPALNLVLRISTNLQLFFMTAKCNGVRP